MWWYCMPVSFLVHVSVWYIVFSIHILFWFMFCIASPTVSPQCCMLRRFWAPTPDLASESDQLYSHVHSQSCWRVYPPTISIVLMCLLSHLHSQHQKEPLVSNAGIQLKKATVENLLKFSKNVISKCVFYWLKHGAASSRVFRRVLLAAKRPRIEALKLQMCVMVISPLFAVILMTDLIPVFKRPTETQHTVNGDEHFVIF